MQKWEFLWVSHEASENSYIANGIKYTYQQYDTIFKVLNRLGEQGWELVTSPAVGVFMLKRPIA
jgi:hypothetical protein